jgi:thioredoxin 1
MMSSVIERVAEEVGDSALVAKVNIDEAPELAEKFSILSIPMIVFFKNGTEVKRISGKSTVADVVGAIKSL